MVPFPNDARMDAFTHNSHQGDNYSPRASEPRALYQATPGITSFQTKSINLIRQPRNSQPDAAFVVFDNQANIGLQVMTSWNNGNIVIQDVGDKTNQYIVLIGNIPWRARWQDLKDLVRQMTPSVERAVIYTDETGRSRGFGYVRIRGKNETEKVAAELDGRDWQGRALQTKIGNLIYGCPVGGVGANARLGPGQTLPPNYPGNLRPPQLDSPMPTRPSSTDRETYPVLPEYYDLEARNRVYERLQHNIQTVNLHFMSVFRDAEQYFKTLYSSLTEQERIMHRGMVDAQQMNRPDMFANLSYQLNIIRGELALAQQHVTYANTEGWRCMFAYSLTFISTQDDNTLAVYPQVPYQAAGQYPKGEPILHAGPYLMFPSHRTEGTPISMQYCSAPGARNTYSTPVHGLPVNTSHGTVQVECKSVFVRNLPYDTSPKELEDFMAGSIKVEMPTRPGGVSVRGHALVTFGTANMAEEACSKYDLSIFKGRQIRVRMDKSGAVWADEEAERQLSTEAIDPSDDGEPGPFLSVPRNPAPVVVDGSSQRA